MSKLPVYLVCKKCGSPNISGDATVRWNFESQTWVVSDIFDNKECDDCGYETDAIYDEILESDLTSHQRDVIDHGGEYFMPMAYLLKNNID